MKRLLDAAGGLLGLLVLVALGIGLIALFREQPTIGRPSPLASPTTMRAAQSPLSTPTPRPTFTRVPAPPTQTPSPTFTPAPPTSTPGPLPTLIPGLETFIYAITGDKGPELYRGQVDQTAHLLDSICQVNTPDLWRSRTYVMHLYPSPDSKRVAVEWLYGDVGTYISILDVNDGLYRPLFGDKAKIIQTAIFLDWLPDGNSVLVLGGVNNFDLKGGIWLVDVRTHEYMDTGIRQADYSSQEILSASLSPDGKAVVYTRRDNYQDDSEVWRVNLDGSERRLLAEIPRFRVEDVLWSPDGRYIAFTQWQESTEFRDFAVGELWLMEANGDNKHLLSPIVTGYFKRFGPVWSPNGQQIAFIAGSGSGKDLKELSSNVYVIDVVNGKSSQLTRFQNAQVIEPIWSPDGSRVALVSSVGGSPEQFEPWTVAADGHGLHRFNEKATLVMSTRASNPAIAWLSGGKR